MRKLFYFPVIILLLLSGCSQSDYSCEDMNSKFDCEGLTAEQCSEDSYVQWAKENCELGTRENPIGL